MMKFCLECDVYVDLLCKPSNGTSKLLYMRQLEVDKTRRYLSFIRFSSHITLGCMARIWWRREHAKREVISFCELILLVKLGATISCSWSCSIARIYYQSEEEWNTSSSCICAYAYITMIYTVIVITIPGRVARYEAGGE